MSSILKALKRVEESGPADDGASRPLRPGDTPPLRLSRRWRPQAWFAGRNRIGWLIAALALAGAVAGYHWWTAETAAPPVPETAKEVRAALPARPTNAAPQAVAPPVRTVQPRAGRPPAPAPEPAVGDAQTSPEVNPALPIQAPPPTSRVRPREGSSGPPPAEARPSPAKRPAPPAERADAARPSAPRTAEDGLSRLDDSKLKVMAIAWATDPSRRLAVVNGHIVKEGETVEGFSVTQIRKDDIIVNEGGRSWRVELNLKSQP